METRPERLFFLGMRPYLAVGEWYWGRTIGRALYKMGWTMVEEKDVAAHFAGIHKATKDTEAHVQILSDISQAFIDAHVGGKVTKMRTDEERPWASRTSKPPPYDDGTMRLVAEVYGLTPDALKREIDILRGLRNFPCVRDSPVLRSMIYQDEL